MKLDSNVLINILKEFDTTGMKDTLIKPRDGGWDMHSMDASCTSIVAAYIKPAAFPEGSTLENDVTVSIPFLLDVLQKDKVCDISTDGGNLTVKYDRSKRSKRLYESEEAPRPAPKLDCMSTCVLMSDDITNIAKQKCFETIITDNGGVTLRMTETGVTFESISEVESAVMSLEGTSVLEGGDQQATFPISVFLPMLRALPKNTMVTVNLKTDFPIHISLDEDTYSMDVYVAPLIAQE